MKELPGEAPGLVGVRGKKECVGDGDCGWNLVAEHGAESRWSVAFVAVVRIRRESMAPS